MSALRGRNEAARWAEVPDRLLALADEVIE